MLNFPMVVVVVVGGQMRSPVSVFLDRPVLSALEHRPSFETRFVRLKVALKTHVF